MRVTWPRESKKKKQARKKKPVNELSEEKAGLIEPEPENKDEKEIGNANLRDISPE